MRSLFYWWCKRTVRGFKHEFKTDWQFRLSVFVLPVVVAAMGLASGNSYLLQKFLGQ